MDRRILTILRRQELRRLRHQTMVEGARSVGDTERYNKKGEVDLRPEDERMIKWLHTVSASNLDKSNEKLNGMVEGVRVRLTRNPKVEKGTGNNNDDYNNYDNKNDYNINHGNHDSNIDD